jgi:hypothetical protein
MAQQYHLSEELMVLKQELLRKQETNMWMFGANSQIGHFEIKSTELYQRYSQLLSSFPAEANRHWYQLRWYKNALFTNTEAKVVSKNAYMYIKVNRLGDIGFTKKRQGSFTFKSPSFWDWKGTSKQNLALQKWIWMAFINDPNIHYACCISTLEINIHAPLSSTAGVQSE